VARPRSPKAVAPSANHEEEVMSTYRMAYGDDTQVVRETYHDVEIEREDGWTVVFRGNDAILRVRDEHIQSLEIVDESAVGDDAAWKTV
jgi:hypothetical protein